MDNARICNLTASAYRRGDGEGVQANPVLTHGGLSAEILTATDDASFERGPQFVIFSMW